MPPDLDVKGLRAQIPATSKLIYLNTGWQGPSPLCVTRAAQEAFAAEAEAPTAPPTHDFRLTEFRRARKTLAQLIGATAEEVSLQQNTTEGINIVLTGLGLRPGDEVLTCSGEHSSVIVPAYFARNRFGASLKIIRVSPEDTTAEILTKFEQAASRSLKLIFLSHISYATGQLFPVRELSELAHEQGAHLLLDAAQSVGQMPVNVRDLGCDFIAFPGRKWLLGPAATGALFVRRDLIERIESSKISHHVAAYYNFKDRFEPKGDTIDKFELTTVSVPLLAGLNSAIEFVQGIGLEAIYERAVSLARYATRRLTDVPGLSFASVADPESVASGLVSFSLPNVAPYSLTAHLWERSNIVARTVPDAACTRLSLHAFNTESEIDAVTETLIEAAHHGVPEREYPSAKLEADAMVEL